MSQAIPTPPVAAPPPVEPVTGRERRSRLAGFLFISPALVVLGIFLVYPAYYTIRLSFYQSDFLFNFTHWVGLDNFKNLLTNDPDFLDLSKFPPSGALVNNIRWVVFYIGLALSFGLALAVLAVRVQYERIVKAAQIKPLQREINLLHAFGHDPIAWLGRDDTVNYALIFAYIWASTGFVMVVLSAAIKGIPAEIMEAARADGAGEWAIFWRIMVPMLSLPISIVTIWLFINVIKVFDIIYVMTGGGPGTSSRVIAFTMYYETFPNLKPGYGAAVAVIMLILVLPVMIVNVRRFRSERVIT